MRAKEQTDIIKIILFFVIILTLFRKIILFFVIMLTLLGLIKFVLQSKDRFLEMVTNPNNSIKTLDDIGFTNITITGWHPFSCGKEDWYRTGFKATNPNGKIVTGTVCKGLLFKGSTVRFD